MNEHLYRSRDDRMLAGVAGGLAELWDADPSLIRIAWALLVILTGGIALLVYIVMAIVVPEDPGVPFAPAAAAAPAAPLAPGTNATQPTIDWRAQQAASRASAREARRAARQARRSTGRRTGTLIFGGALVLIGAWFLLREYVPAFDTDLFWPIALVGLGILILAMAVRPRNDDHEVPFVDGGSAPPVAPPVATTAAPGPASGPTTSPASGPATADQS